MLRALREAKGLTQERLAARAKVARPYITMLETGAKKNPSLALLKRLSKALNVTVADLIWEGKPAWRRAGRR